jgi:glycosyltransferase involved in cell wall biosynthesis
MSGVSVVVPAYNAASTIRGCLESVRKQTIPDVEILVVDDGSEDETASIAAAVPGVRVMRQGNAGPASARNRGIAAASGEWIAFLDADDEWTDSRKLEKQLACALSHGAALVGASGHGGPDTAVGLRRLLRGNPFVTSTVLAAKAAIVECGGFELGRYYSEDYLLWLRMVARRGKAVLCGTEGSRNLRGREAYDQGGLSGRLLAMEAAELANFRALFREGLLGHGLRGAILLVLASSLSSLKFLRRVAIRCFMRPRDRE